jgi:uncharacterized membrane protein
VAHDIFVSYSQHDREAAERISTILEHSGFTCWIAPRDILPSMTWAASIVQAIKQCRVMVLVFSGNANRSDQIPREVTLAEEQHVRVIPVRIENVRPTGDLEYYLPSTQWLDLFPKPLEAYTPEIVRVVTALLAQQRATAGEATSHYSTTQSSAGPTWSPPPFNPSPPTSPYSRSQGPAVSKSRNLASAGTATPFSGLEKLYLGMCYLMPYFFAGALVLIVDQKRLARFHAWQTILIGVIADTLMVASGATGSDASNSNSAGSIAAIVVVACWVLAFLFWFGKKIRLPFISPIAERLSGWRFSD